MFAVMAFTAHTSAQSVDIPFYGDYLQLQVKTNNDDIGQNTCMFVFL